MDKEKDLARYCNYLVFFSRKNVLLWRYPMHSQETYTSRQEPCPSKHWHWCIGYRRRLSLLPPPLLPWQIGPLWRWKTPVTNHVHPISSLSSRLEIGFPPWSIPRSALMLSSWLSTFLSPIWTVSVRVAVSNTEKCASKAAPMLELSNSFCKIPTPTYTCAIPPPNQRTMPPR